jgi:outer membrane protein with beta-barrel domain
MVTPRLIPVCAVLLIPAAAEARETISAGLKAGVGLSQPFSDLGTGPEFELEGGYTLPWVGHRLRALLQVGYQRTGSSDRVQDARFVSDGSYTFDLHEDELTVMPAIFGQWFAPGSRRWTPYAALGPRVYMLRTKIDGAAGTMPQDFGPSTEESTKVGFGLQLGAEFTLGPGALLGELAMVWSPLDHRTTGDTNTGSLGINVGYRLMF